MIHHGYRRPSEALEAPVLPPPHREQRSMGRLSLYRLEARLRAALRSHLCDGQNRIRELDRIYDEFARRSQRRLYLRVRAELWARWEYRNGDGGRRHS